MNYIAGQTLERWTRSVDRSPQALAIRLRVAQQLANAMLAAHETVYVDHVGFEVHGDLHGDLKPANVIVSSGDTPVVLDFLLVDVQRLLDPRVIPALTAYKRKAVPTTAAFGTPGFMAQEQAEHGIVTVSTDIYGLGVTLCHLFLPNQASREIEIKQDAKLPAFLKKLLGDMTAAEPRLRPDSMRDVVQRLGSQPQMRWFQKWIAKPSAWFETRKK